MVEYIREITYEVEVDTNKETYKISGNADSLSEVIEKIEDFKERMS